MMKRRCGLFEHGLLSVNLRGVICKCRFLCVFVLDCRCVIGVDRVRVGEDKGRGGPVEYFL